MLRRHFLLALSLGPTLGACVQPGSLQLAGGPVGPIGSSSGDAAAAAQLVSAYRVSHGLNAVVADARLNAAAAASAKYCAQIGTLDHGDFSGRMAQYGIRGSAAENLTAGSDNVATAMSRWEASPAHNANLLLPGARRIGIARADSPGRGYGRYWALVLAG